MVPSTALSFLLAASAILLAIIMMVLMSARVPSELTADAFLHEPCENVLSGSDLDPSMNLEIHAGDGVLVVRDTGVGCNPYRILIKPISPDQLREAFGLWRR